MNRSVSLVNDEDLVSSVSGNCFVDAEQGEGGESEADVSHGARVEDHQCAGVVSIM